MPSIGAALDTAIAKHNEEAANDSTSMSDGHWLPEQAEIQKGEEHMTGESFKGCFCHEEPESD